jgi:hypothetical protein
MARDLPELIACEGCGTLNEQATALLDQARDDIANLEKELRGKRAKISRLEADRFAKLRQHKKYEAAMDVLRHWQATCAPKAREIDSQERLSAVLARLTGGHTVAELKLCATGYAKRPYVGKGGRSSTGKPNEWFADAELIYRSAEHVRKGIALAATTDAPESAGPIDRLSWRRVWHANRKLILDTLAEQYGRQALLKHPSGYTLSWCPKCSRDDDGIYRPLRIADEPGRYLAECQGCGLNDTRLIAAITKESNDG